MLRAVVRSNVGGEEVAEVRKAERGGLLCQGFKRELSIYFLLNAIDLPQLDDFDGFMRHSPTERLFAGKFRIEFLSQSCDHALSL